MPVCLPSNPERMDGIRGGATTGARARRPLLLALLLLLVAGLLQAAVADPLASHTFVPPFGEVQVDGKRLVSTYVRWTWLRGWLLVVFFLTRGAPPSIVR